MWRIKYLQEFISEKDRNRGKYASPEGQEKFMNLFRDNIFDPKGTRSMYEFFMDSFEKQKRVRTLIKGIVSLTHNYTMKQTDAAEPTGNHESLLNYIRPF